MTEHTADPLTPQPSEMTSDEFATLLGRLHVTEAQVQMMEGKIQMLWVLMLEPNHEKRLLDLEKRMRYMRYVFWSLCVVLVIELVNLVLRWMAYAAVQP